MDELSKRNFAAISQAINDMDVRVRNQDVELGNLRNALAQAIGRVSTLERMLQLPHGHGPTAH